MKEEKKVPIRVVQLVTGIFLLVVVALLLLSIANYPVQWRAQVDAERGRSLEVIVEAFNLYAWDHDELLPDVPVEPHIMSNSNECSFECPAIGRVLPCYDIRDSLVPQYLREIPQDPLLLSESNSGYYLVMNDGVITAGACNHFFGDSLTRTQ